MSLHYDHQKIEKKWQQFWAEKNTFLAPDDSPKEKYYVLDMFPYPSSAGLHVGHPLGYTATDIISRYERMRGKNVMHPMGWDAFGLPAENYAIKTKVHPAQTTFQSITTFRRQIQELGFSYDWEREIGTCFPDYYRWTQWFFVFLYEKGLAYRKNAPVNWCDHCHTVLANEQVINGRCERCKNEVVQRKLEQWFFKITDFIEDQGGTKGLLNGLDTIDWPDSTKIAQRNWIGKSEGAEVNFEIGGKEVRIFTTRPDTLFGATYFVLSPEHPLVLEITTPEQKAEVEKYLEETAKKSELERSALDKEKTGVFTGAYAINPVNQEKIPVWIADYVLMTYGTGAIMAVPAHDERDFEFAKKYDLPIKVVVRPKGIISPGEPLSSEETRLQQKIYSAVINGEEPWTSFQGGIINSDFITGLNVEEGKEKIIEWLEKEGKGKGSTQYKLRDWLVSRQRYWGAPIPVVYDDGGNEYVLPLDELPVELPDDVDFMPTGESPLVHSKKFHSKEDLARIEKKLKAAGKMPAERTLVKRESDTMDTFVCSSWYFFRFMDPQNSEVFASKELMEKWGPVDLYVGGAEHTVLHLLYSRFFTKALHKYGYISYDEPFSKLRHQGMILGEDGSKMSKSVGNVINPDEIIEAFGADTLRCYEMFMGPFDQRKPWSTGGVEGVRRFLDRVWRVFQKEIDEATLENADLLTVLHQSIKTVAEHVEDFRFNTALSQLMVLTNELTKLEKAPKEALETFALLLAPFAPHMAEEVWHEVLGHEESLAYHSWPEYEEKYLVSDTVSYAVQVNGKVRADFQIEKGVEKEEVIAKAKSLEKVQKYLSAGEIKKEIFVPEKIVGFVVK